MNLLIVDDHFLVRKGLEALFKEESNIECIQEASNIDEAMSIIIKDKPDIVLVDLKLGKEDGLELVVKSKTLDSLCKFIIITSFISHENFLRGEEIGIDGYIIKDAFSEDIFYAISAVSRGKKYYDPSIIDYKDTSKKDTMIEALTDREKDVLRELGKGYSNDDIAKELYISKNTVKKHVSSIFSKLNINHRTQAAVLFNNI
jgi:two-component system nitrate/nitrite response regulator NarL